MRRRLVLIVLELLVSATALSADSPGLESSCSPWSTAHRGTVAVAVKHLQTGEAYAFQAARPMPTASLIKFPLMISAYRKVDDGSLKSEQIMTLADEDKVPGSGILSDHFSAGVTFSAEGCHPLDDRLFGQHGHQPGCAAVGLSQVSQDMEAFGCPETKMHSFVFRRDTSIFPERSQKYGLGSTTANEMIMLLEGLERQQWASPAACEQMLDQLSACADRSKIARYLPAGVRFAHKSGDVMASKTDAGIIFAPSGPIAICVLTDQNQDRQWGDENAANVLCSEIGRAVYTYFHPDEDVPAQSGILKLGSQGTLVEQLQRTLNARLQPSPALAVDGDYGPNTEKAVWRYQQERGLAVTGEVGPDMWESLGVLEAEEAVPDPAEVNGITLDRSPPDPLHGRPYVTAQAWGIFDGDSGELLDGAQVNERREMASTTKIMTAYVVLNMVEEQPQIRQELVTFSRRADQTIGSSCTVREGEQLSVDELLYGLLLPSGNDASVALAEHFGGKLPVPEDASAPRPGRYERFIAAMNQTATELRLQQTHFVNPHGLPDPEHYTTVGDLGRLACRALRNPDFCRYVSTRQRGCDPAGPGRLPAECAVEKHEPFAGD